jgi:ketosteroid isomerase-like protein
MSTTTDQVHELGARWVTAEIAADVDTLENIVTDDFRLVGPFGFVLDKGQWLDRYRSGDFHTAELSWHDVDIRDYGDTAVAIGTNTQKAAYKGSPSDGDYRITHVFIRRDDAWTIANIQLSLTTPPPARATS